MNDKQKKALKKLGLNDSEIQEVLIADSKIDKGEKLFELSKDQKQVEKKLRSTGTKQKITTYDFKTRTRKPNFEKREIIDWLSETLIEHGATVNITNIEREFTFTMKDLKTYKVVLSIPRK